MKSAQEPSGSVHLPATTEGLAESDRWAIAENIYVEKQHYYLGEERGGKEKKKDVVTLDQFNGAFWRMAAQAAVVATCAVSPGDPLNLNSVP